MSTSGPQSREVSVKSGKCAPFPWFSLFAAERPRTFPKVVGSCSEYYVPRFLFHGGVAQPCLLVFKLVVVFVLVA